MQHLSWLAAIAPLAFVCWPAIADKVDDDKQKEVLINRPDSNLETIQAFTTANRYRKAGGGVGRLVTTFSNGAVGYCTATLVSPDLVITASHCLKDPDDDTAAIISIILYLDDVDPASARGTPYQVQIAPLEAQKKLDYAILRVPNKPGLQAQFKPISLESRPLTAHEELFLIHHPQAQAQHLTRRACRVRGPFDNDTVLHTCDTQEGSSGAALMSDNETRPKIIAIHTGFKRLGAQEKINIATTIQSIAAASCIVQKLLIAGDPDVCQQVRPPSADDGIVSPPITARSGAKINITSGDDRDK